MDQISRSGFFRVVANKAQAEKEPGFKTTVEAGAPEYTGIAPYGGTWGQEQVLHLLRRSLFGVTQEDYRYFSKLTLQQSLDVLLSDLSIPEPPINAYNDSMYQDPDVPFGETWVNCLVNETDANQKRLNSLYAWWVGLMLDPQRSIARKMTLFWHNHMACELQSTYDARPSYSYLALILKYALGNFKTLISELTICPAMLEYLSGNESKAEAPNENYSREMQELFTVGKGPDSHYTQEDINAAARVLTGWTTTLNGMKTIYNAAVHDSGDKHFSAFYNNTVIRGRTGKESAEETKELIDMIFATKEVAKHTCRCLYRWFVDSSLDSTIEVTVIDPLAEILIESKFEIKPVLRALLGGRHFYDPVFVGCQIKNPVDYTLGFCRTFDAIGHTSDLALQYKAWHSIVDLLSKQSMCPGEPPNVAGWPAYYLSPGYDKLWINSDSIVQRDSAMDTLLSEQGLDSSTKIKFDVLTFTAGLSDPKDPDVLIADSITMLSAAPFGPVHTRFLRNILGSGSDRSWTDLWTAHIASPDDQQTKDSVTLLLNTFYNYIVKREECHLI
jgi:uncharacterized protein (DUF1800 family)